MNDDLLSLCPSDSLCPGQTDEGVLVPEPLGQADGAANQEDVRQDPQLPGEGQGVVRGGQSLPFPGRSSRREATLDRQMDDEARMEEFTGHPASTFPYPLTFFTFALTDIWTLCGMKKEKNGSGLGIKQRVRTYTNC